MTFGTEWGWGSPADTARRILDRYLDAGGNFVDTADMYTGGKGEEQGLSRQLDEASRIGPGFPYVFYGATMQGMITGGTEVRGEPKWFR